MVEKNPNKGGRPRKDTHARQFPLYIYMMDEESLQQVKEAAERQGLSFSTWARTVLVREARRILSGE